MAREIFVDTSGFFALLVQADESHPAAVGLLKKARQERRGFVTSDYVLDETATLLKARGHGHLLGEFFGLLLSSRACRVEWMESVRFDSVRTFFLKHSDQSWSFTDCASFCLMKELDLSQALTKDVHFAQAGFVPLLRG
ncbi:MAG: type II toxin-antitoxin system VapC family toxin [Armatimonadetes bacterium]|nr:type II toxin-antitoxin system VapC family toxin [Armatimonadota bacterium]